MERSALCNRDIELCYSPESVFTGVYGGLLTGNDSVFMRICGPTHLAAPVTRWPPLFGCPVYSTRFGRSKPGRWGAYAYPSMLDRSYMRLFRFSPAFIEQAVREQQSDMVIATSIQTRAGLTDEEVLALSRRFHRTYCVALHMLDRDDGYASGIGYPLPRFLQTPVWHWYQCWAARKASADAV